MEYLFDQVKGSQSVVVLADNRGTLMHTLGDAHFLSKAERVALACGACWSEEQRGTNAIGTALADVSGVEIHGAEHYLERNSFLTCAAAPIMSASGQLLGILDISGDQHHGHPHTLGLADTAARMIENRLLIAGARRNTRLHLHAWPEGIGTFAEGLVVVSDEGWIIGANRSGMALLRITARELGQVQIESLLDLHREALQAHPQQRTQQVMQVHRRDGCVLYAQIVSEPPPRPARRQIAAEAQDALTAIDSGDTRWRLAADRARRVMDKDIALLLQGESGVGKEFFARAVHDSSARRDAAFVAINCAAIPENLLEAELFGYQGGAFTGARREGSLGRLREAQGGTLLLDEIGDMPLAMQTRLLRVLQERSVTPLGGGRPVPVDFSLICATHCDLLALMERGQFRSDLYYRINGLCLQLPALRERGDFQELTTRLLQRIGGARQDLQLSIEVFAAMSRHDWPGNLRQYASVLRSAAAMLDDSEDCIEWQHLPDDIAEQLTAGPRSKIKAAVVRSPQSLHELSRNAIAQALADCRGNVSLAARTLGISRQTMYRKLKS
jgi:transcriptional regulator of acetoin/glycerol metabolism